MEAGFLQAQSKIIVNSLPISWLGRADAPQTLPSWATIGHLTSVEVQNLLAEIGYDQSQWNYNLIGSNNELGKYQFSTELLEKYGLLAKGSNNAYGTDCVNYRRCWQQVTLRGSNSYSNFLYNCTSLQSFLTTTISQEHLAYQVIYDTYTRLVNIGAILESDTNDVVAGMIYVGWIYGDASLEWRQFGVQDAARYYNAGRYAISVLSNSQQQMQTTTQQQFLWTQLPNGTILPGNQLGNRLLATGQTNEQRGAKLVYLNAPYPPAFTGNFAAIQQQTQAQQNFIQNYINSQSQLFLANGLPSTDNLTISQPVVSFAQNYAAIHASDLFFANGTLVSDQIQSQPTSDIRTSMAIKYTQQNFGNISL